MTFLPPLGVVDVAKRRFGWPDSLLRLFHPSLAGFLGKVVDVVLGHQHFDAMYELFRRAGIPR